MLQLGAVHARIIQLRLIKASSKRESRVKESRGLSSLGSASRERGKRVSNPTKANNPRLGASDTCNTQYVVEHIEETDL